MAGGCHSLIRLIDLLRRAFPKADLLIAGGGAEESELRKKARLLGLESAVSFAGHLSRPYECFLGATLFVLSSRHEGMPNALLEAAAAGLPIVALPSSGGVVDLLRNRPGAWVATNISAESLADSLLAALEVLHPQKESVRSESLQRTQALRA